MSEAARAWLFVRKGSRRGSQANGPKVDVNRVAERLAGAIRYKTRSYQDNVSVSGTEFLRLNQYLKPACPLVHKSLTREIVGDIIRFYIQLFL